MDAGLDQWRNPMGLPRARRGWKRWERNHDHRSSIAEPRPPVVTRTSMGMPVPSVVAITPVVVISIVTPITLVVTPPVVGPVTFLVATPTIVATPPSARALQRNQDRGGDDGTPYPLHGFHRFTPTRRTGRHDPRSRTGRTPREGEAGDGSSPDEPNDLGNCLSRR